VDNLYITFVKQLLSFHKNIILKNLILLLKDRYLVHNILFKEGKLVLLLLFYYTINYMCLAFVHKVDKLV